MLAWLRKLLLFVVVVIVAGAAGTWSWWSLGDWQKRAAADVAFLHETIETHHPGPVDPENPGFRTQMEEALANADALVPTVKTRQDHRKAIKAYTNTFKDGHLTVWPYERLPSILMRFSSSSPAAKMPTSIASDGQDHWITISSFTESVSTVAEVTTEIEERRDELRNADTIVFDLRGNGGGNSAFGTRIAQALWSKEVFLDWVPVSAQAVDWRATPENAEHVFGIAKSNEKKGREAAAAAWQRVAEGIQGATENGEDYYRQTLTTRETTRTLPSPVQAQVIVLTDGSCASACLDFMDLLTALPGVTHMGKETSSDTQYMDVRFSHLKSKTGMLILPLKVYRGRMRPSGGTYVPEVPVDLSSGDFNISSIGELKALVPTEEAPSDEG
ncbi:MAG: hypothetical protein HRU11_00970 [Parvularculaceae bacterium]|nr:hypothetical protein [Parvularculaceae bacterium]